MGIQELVLENGIRILKKPVYITFEQIQECLDKAHEVNAVKGLVYATQGQTVEKLIEKLKDAVTYVALMPDVPDYVCNNCWRTCKGYQNTNSLKNMK